MGLANINIRFNADMKQFSTEMQSALRDITKIGQKFQGVGAVLSVGLTAPILAFGVASVSAFNESAKAVAQVEAGLKSTGGAVGLSSAQLQKMAADLQNVTTFDDDQILKQATANFLTFDKIQGATFDAAQKAALDLATRLDGDLQGAAIQVGKALQDPIKGVTALSKVGVSFSDSQKKAIKSMVETNNLAGAQAIILKELNKEFGGSAEAAAKAGTGGWQQLKNQIGDVSEEFGKIILEAIDPFRESIKGIVASFQSLSPEAKKTIAIIAGITAVVGPLLLGFGTILTLVPAMVAGFTAVSGALGTFTAFVAANPIGAIAVAIGLVVGALILFQEKQTSLNDVVAQGNKNAAEEIGVLDKLYATATNAKISTEERTAAVDKLQALYPAYLKNIDDEAIKSGKAAGVIDELRDAIFNKARAMAVDNELQKRANDRINDELKLRTEITATEREIARLRKLSGDVTIKGSAQDKTLDVTIKKSDLIAAQTKLLKIQKDDLVKFNNEAKASDEELLNAKQEFSSKTGKLAQNEIDKINEIKAANVEGAAAIDKLAPGTIAYFKSLISLLQKEQEGVVTNNAEWEKKQLLIDAYQKKIDALQGKGPINLPKPEVPILPDGAAPDTPTFSLQNLKEQQSYFEKQREQFSATSDEYRKLTDQINNTEIKIKAIDSSNLELSKENIAGAVEFFKSKSEEAAKIHEQISKSMVDTFDSMAGSLVDSMGLAETGFQGFVKGLLQTVIKLISMMLAQSIAQSIAGATATGAATGPAAVFTTPAFIATAIGGVLAAFASIPKFETGGIFGGSSYYGDKILARVNSGEMVMNNRQQQTLWNGMNSSSGGSQTLIPDVRISGTDLLLIFDRAAQNNKRIF